MARAARFSSRVDIALFVGALLLSLIVVVLPAQMREPIAGSLRSSLVAPLVWLQRSAERWRAAWLASEAQQARTDTVALRAFTTHAAEDEDAQLRRLLGLGSRLRWGFVPAEALHSTTRENVVTAVTLTAGTNAGIRRYSPVVSADGIVGMVQTADPTVSIAILFTHPDFRASAMSADGSAFGIVYPHFGTDEERYFLELRGVPFRASLKPGVQIFTSGLGGTFPRGIPIGAVIREQRTAEGWTRTYLVRPAVSPANLTAVMVLSPQRVSQGVGNVWAAVGSVDSAARRIVAAGDSLAREAALAEAAARRAAQDSARRLPVGTDTSTRRDTTQPDTARQPRPRSLVPRDSIGRVVRQPPPSPARRDSMRPATTTTRRGADSAIRRRRPPSDSAKRDSARSDTARRPKP